MNRHELLAGFICGLLPFVLLLPIKLWIATLFPCSPSSCCTG